MEPNYCRTIWLDPEDTEHFILGLADGPDYNGWIIESADSGKNWQTRMQGMEKSWSRTMVEHFVP